MARIKFSGIGITEMRGGLGDDVFFRNRAGAVVRKKSSKPWVSSTRRNNMIELLSEVDSDWLALTDQQRGDWNKAAGTGQLNYLRKHNKISNITGREAFISKNLKRKFYGLLTDSSIPQAPTGMPGPPQNVSLTAVSMTELTCNLDLEASTLSLKISLFLGNGMSQATYRPPRGRLVKVGIFDYSTGPNFFNLLSLYTSEGLSFSAGQKVFLLIKFFHPDSGFQLEQGLYSVIAT